MASQQAGQEIPQINAQTAGQAQPRNKDEFLEQVSDAVMQEALDNLANAQSAQNNNTYTSQATNLLQQTGEQVKNMAQGAGEQVKNMAQGAADAVKNTLGINADNTNTTLPIDHSAGAGTTVGSSLNAEHPSNPTNNINITTTNPRI